MQRLKARNFFENEQFLFYISTYTIPSKKEVEPHSHEFFELVYVVEGNGKHIYEECHYSIKEGDVFIIEPDKIHGFKGGETGDLKVFNLLYQLEFIRKEIELLSGVDSFLSFFYVEPFVREFAHFKEHIVLNHSEQTDMKILLQGIALEYTKKELGYRTMIKTRMIELFIFLNRCIQNRLTPLMPNTEDDRKAINRILRFINSNYNAPLSLEEVCRLSGMSKSNFTAKFKQIVGKTFIEYRNTVRIKAAMGLLITTNEKILSISNKVGFEDVSYFNRAFKEFTNMSPSRYRKKSYLEKMEKPP